MFGGGPGNLYGFFETKIPGNSEMELKGE